MPLSRYAVALFAAARFFRDGHLDKAGVQRRSQIRCTEMLLVLKREACLYLFPAQFSLENGQQSNFGGDFRGNFRGAGLLDLLLGSLCLTVLLPHKLHLKCVGHFLKNQLDLAV
jgi:hypothetical protein